MLNQVVRSVTSKLEMVKQGGGWQWRGTNALARLFDPTHTGRKETEKSYIFLNITGDGLLGIQFYLLYCYVIFQIRFGFLLYIVDEAQKCAVLQVCNQQATGVGLCGL